MLVTNDPDTWPLLLYFKHVMAITGIGKNKALSMIQSGELPMIKLRGQYVISRKGMLTWLEQYGGQTPGQSVPGSNKNIITSVRDKEKE